MVLETKVIRAQDSSGIAFDLSIEVAKRRDWCLSYRGSDGAAHLYEASDVFTALQRLREDLQPRGIKVLCARTRTEQREYFEAWVKSLG